MNKPHIWTIDEIIALAEPDDDLGWFYGLIRDRESGRVVLGEVLPGYGYTPGLRGGYFLRRPKDWWRLLGCLLWHHHQPNAEGEELARRVAIVRQRQREEEAEADRRAEIGKTCTHPHRQPGLDSRGWWCPDCWELSLDG